MSTDTEPKAERWDGEVVVRRKATPLVDIAATLAALGTGLWTGFFGPKLTWMFGFTAFAIAGLAVRPLLRQREPGGVRIQGDRLVLGKRAFPRSELQSAALLPTGDTRATVELTTKKEVFAIELPLADARRLLDALELNGAEERLRVRRLEHGMTFAAGSFGVAAPVLVAAFAAIFGEAAAYATFWLGLASIAGWLGMARLVHTFVQPSPLDVGADGISWRDSMEGKRFVAHRDIVSVELEKSPLTQKEDLTRLVIGVADSPYPEEIELGPVPEVVASAVRARIAQALGEEGDPLPLLQRGNESLAAWRKKLRQLVGQGDYRDARVPRVRVASVLEDPLADAKQRLAAAIALAESTDPKTRDFGRKLAGRLAPALVDEDLAHALVAVSKGELKDEELEAYV